MRFLGDAVLAQTAAPVTQFDAALDAFVQDLFDTMYAAPGRGLAAPQVGVSRRVFVTDVTWKDSDPTPIAFINPTVLARSDDLQDGTEGCLSIPDRSFTVTRPTWVQMRWQLPTGEVQEARLDGMQAICACHELDHLNGVLITDIGEQI